MVWVEDLVERGNCCLAPATLEPNHVVLDFNSHLVCQGVTGVVVPELGGLQDSLDARVRNGLPPFLLVRVQKKIDESACVFLTAVGFEFVPLYP